MLRRIGLHGIHGIGGVPHSQMAYQAAMQHTGYFWLEFDGDSSYIDCGSDAVLDGIPDQKSFTVDAWVKCDSIPDPDELGRIICKAGDNEGWLWQLSGAGAPVLASVIFAATPAISVSNETLVFGPWFHLLMTYNFGVDRSVYFAIDGLWCTYAMQQASAGAYLADSAFDLIMGADTARSALWLHGGIQWLRISNTVRYPIGVDFSASLPAMCAPPAVDANTLELWAMDEGTGVLAAASVHRPHDNGTLKDCPWHICVEPT